MHFIEWNIIINTFEIRDGLCVFREFVKIIIVKLCVNDDGFVGVAGIYQF